MYTASLKKIAELQATLESTKKELGDAHTQSKLPSISLFFSKLNTESLRLCQSLSLLY